MKNYIVALSLFLLTACGGQEEKVAVIDLPSLYNSFDYQKELNGEFQKIESEIQSEKDSLTKQIQNIELSLAQSAEFSDVDKNILFERSYSDYLAKQQYLDYYKDSVANNYSEKVWNQLNSYVEQYGEENSFDVIIGMQGNGNVMYAREGVNITDEVVAYANQKYHGN